jgi:hypothetical protein
MMQVEQQRQQQVEQQRQQQVEQQRQQQRQQPVLPQHKTLMRKDLQVQHQQQHGQVRRALR